MSDKSATEMIQASLRVYLGVTDSPDKPAVRQEFLSMYMQELQSEPLDDAGLQLAVAALTMLCDIQRRQNFELKEEVETIHREILNIKNRTAGLIPIG